MSGLKQLRNRVRSINSTQKITKAMQVVSAAKLKKLKDKAEQLNDFSDVLANVMDDISASGNLMDMPKNDRMFFSRELENKPRLLVVMTTERGLCGGFNTQVIKRTKKDIAKFKADGEEVKLIIVGKKGYAALKNAYGELICAYYNVGKDNTECVASQVRDKIISLIESGEAGSCFMYYNRFKNAITQVMTKLQVLPAIRCKTKSAESQYEYEGLGLVRDVINLYIGSQLNYGLLQSRASEEGARMTAMDNATRNAGELIESLTLQLNRSRQAIITTELTEIISGAEAI